MLIFKHLHHSVKDNVQSAEADLGMFSMFGRTGAPQKGAPTRGPVNFCNIATCRK